MSFKNKIKCLIEQIILVSIIFCVLVILGLVVKNIVSSLISFLPESLYYVVYNGGFAQSSKTSKFDIAVT